MIMTTVLILGLGEFGSNIAKRMSEFKCEVMAVDIKEERVDDILPFVGSARIGDSTNEEFLRSLGVNSYDVCIVALGGLFQSSLETTNLLKELGAPFVVSRATNDVQMKFLKMSGADEVVYPEAQMARWAAMRYNYSIYEMKAPKEWFGKTLAQIDIRKKFKINMLTIKRGNEVFIPAHDTVIQNDDVAFIIGEVQDIHKCFKV